VQIHSAIHEIFADKAFIATDGLISQLFVVTFVHFTYVWIALIWGFPVQPFVKISLLVVDIQAK